MRTVVVGNRALARHVLTYLLETEWHIVGAISAAGDAARQQAGYVPFADLADEHDLEVIPTTDINSAETQSALEDLQPDLCVCPGWHQIIDERVLDVPTHGFVGFHAADLPRGRGGAPVNWSLIHGESAFPVSLFYYSSGVDAGELIHKEWITVEDRDNIDTVLDKLAVAACDALAATQTDFEAETVDTTPQQLPEATYRPRRQPQDGLIDWTRPATELYDWIRAQTDPYPGAYTFWNGDRVRVWDATVSDESAPEVEPGTVRAAIDGVGLDVETGDGILRLKRVQRDDRPRVWADEFGQQHQLAGERFGREHAPPSWLYTGIRDADGGTDFTSASNLSLGETGEIRAVVESATDQPVTVRATFDDSVVTESQLTGPERESEQITYQADSRGTYTLSVAFFEDDTQIDTRYLKVFVS